MDGEIGVESSPEQGSTFWFTVVLEQPQAPELPSAELTHTSTAKIDARILVVEDIEVNQQLIVRMLKILGYQADAVSNGQEALDRLVEQSYNIVLMDCQMPILDGYETTQLLRRYSPCHVRRSPKVLKRWHG